MTVFVVEVELLVAALGRDAVALATRLPLALLLLALCGWPNLVQWLGEGRFTAEVDPRTLRLDRSQVAESWRARGLAPLLCRCSSCPAPREVQVGSDRGRERASVLRRPRHACANRSGSPVAGG